MQPIKTQGNEIIDIKVMQQSKRARVTIELTEEDTKVLAGSLMAWRANGLLFDSEFKPSEIQGNDNGTKLPESKESSIYNNFRLKCIEYSGEDYYEDIKAHLNVVHLSSLEADMSKSMIEDVLSLQEYWMWAKQHGFENFTPNVSSLTHKDNAVNKWKNLFESFNNAKTKERTHEESS